MTHIKTGIDQPGILELLFYKGPTGKALSSLAHTLLHGPSPMSKGDRELIASYVSSLNNCSFCHDSHRASANEHFGDKGNKVDAVKIDLDSAPVSDKMKALLKIAAMVQQGGKSVTTEHVDKAKKLGASDEEIHDTVLIAAAFCMYNRYVDGMGTNVPADKTDYLDMGKMMAYKGYKYPPLFLRKFVIKMMERKRKKVSNA